MHEAILEYTEEERDRLEREASRRELIFEHRGGMDIIVYWLKKSDTVYMQLIDSDGKRVFVLPNAEVMSAVNHPEVYAANAGKPRTINRHEVSDG